MGINTLLRQTFTDARCIDLLEADTFREPAVKPELIRQRLTSQETLIIIDEVRKLPLLLDEVRLLRGRYSSAR